MAKDQNEIRRGILGDITPEPTSARPHKGDNTGEPNEDNESMVGGSPEWRLATSAHTRARCWSG